MALSPEWTWKSTNSELDDASYYETAKSKMGGFAQDNSAIERVFTVKGGEDNAIRDKFVNDLLGYSEWVEDGAAEITRLHRVLPDQDPYSNFYCCEVKYEGKGQVSYTGGAYPTAQWDYYEVYANYKPLPYAVKADSEVTYEYQRFCSFDYKTNAEYMSVGGAMKFVGSGRTMASPPGKIILSAMLTITWHDVPALSTNPFQCPTFTHIVDNVGKVNLNPFLGNPYGTVLFLGAEPRMRVPTLGSQGGDPLKQFKWEIPYQFAVKDNGEHPLYGEHCGWNYFWDTEQTSGFNWDVVTDSGTFSGLRLYEETGNFANLFTQG